MTAPKFLPKLSSDAAQIIACLHRKESQICYIKCVCVFSPELNFQHYVSPERVPRKNSVKHDLPMCLSTLIATCLKCHEESQFFLSTTIDRDRGSITISASSVFFVRHQPVFSDKYKRSSLLMNILEYYRLGTLIVRQFVGGAPQ